MDNLINSESFLQQLTYFIKVGIYINKGTIQENILDKCIKLHNKYKLIELECAMDSSSPISNENEAHIRKCVKRINLVLKITKKMEPINIQNKENQKKIMDLEGHPSLYSDDLDAMIKFASKNNLTILTDIPLMFILKESKYQELLWQYTRSLFFITQILILNSGLNLHDEKKNKTNDNIIKNIMDILESILSRIADIESDLDLKTVLSSDKFLNIKLANDSSIDKQKIGEAKKEVKNIFDKKGIGCNATMSKIIDAITNKLEDIDLKNCNIFENIFSIAQNVATEMRDEISDEISGDSIQPMLGAITDIFQDNLNAAAENKDSLPKELHNIFDSFKESIDNNNITDIQNLDQSIYSADNNILKELGCNLSQFTDFFSSGDL